MRDRPFRRGRLAIGERTPQRVRQNFDDLHAAKLSNQWSGAIDMHRLQIGAAPNPLPLSAPRLFEQYRKRGASAALIEGILLLGEKRLQFLEPVVLHAIGNLPRRRRRGGSGPGAIFEGKGPGVTNLADQSQARFAITG